MNANSPRARIYEDIRRILSAHPYGMPAAEFAREIYRDTFGDEPDQAYLDRTLQLLGCRPDDLIRPKKDFKEIAQ